MNTETVNYRCVAQWGINACGLRPLWDYLCLTARRDVTYHNMLHAEAVVGTMVSMASLYGFSVHRAVLAGLFHDFNHPGHGPDSDNVQAAVEAFRRFGTADFTVNGRRLIGDLPEGAAKEIEEAIACTEYDSARKSFPKEPTSMLGKALRDADLATVYQPVEVAGLLLAGLYYELNAVRPAGTKSLGVDSFLEASRTFLSEARRFTDYIDDQRCQRVSHLKAVESGARYWIDKGPQGVLDQEQELLGQSSALLFRY